MGRQEVKELREVGKLLAYLKEPEPPEGFKVSISCLYLPSSRNMPGQASS
ncbi:hypothetical protein O9992_08740 [Vibrio lentus]|nr:hypothetical protein [Vibrio lentus]